MDQRFFRVGLCYNRCAYYHDAIHGKHVPSFPAICRRICICPAGLVHGLYRHLGFAYQGRADAYVVDTAGDTSTTASFADSRARYGHDVDVVAADTFSAR